MKRRPPINPVTFVAGQIADDVAYGAGVYAGCLRHANVTPLRPVLPAADLARSRSPLMANPWFESVAEAQRRAKKRLPKSVYGALVAGSERGVTLFDNEAAFAELGFAPHVAGLQPSASSTTTVMGQSISLPVIISPTGVQAVHPDGEVAVARAAAARGTAMGLSSFASKPIEEVVAANPQTFFQMYWTGSREQMIARIERARAAGAVGLIVTLDWSFSMGRDWGSPAIPEQIDAARDAALCARSAAPSAVARRVREVTSNCPT